MVKGEKAKGCFGLAFNNGYGLMRPKGAVNNGNFIYPSGYGRIFIKGLSELRS